MRNMTWKGAAMAALMTAFSFSGLTSCSAPTPTPPEVPPVITSFKADKTQVTAGTAVKLTFTAERAQTITLLDQTGTSLSLTGDVNAGEATVSPTETSFYVLRATGAGGRDSAFVQVAVNEGLREVFLVAVPAEVSSGDTVTVAWSALGGSGITLKDAAGTTLSMNESGTLDVKPAKSTSYELKATGLLGPLSAKADVKVRPVISSFSADPPAARQGQTLTFAWKTAGADSVKLTEPTLGEIVTITSQASVDQGELEVVVPSDFNADAGPLADGGMAPPRPVPDNFPLQFKLTAETVMPAQSVSKELTTYVRSGPSIVDFDVPAFVTEAKPATVRWTVLDAARVEVLLDGARAFTASTASGAPTSFTLPAVTADVNVTLVVYDFNGLSVRLTKVLKVSRAPVVNTFTVPMNIASGGGNAAATWTTSNATSVVIRIKNGPVEYRNTGTMVASGMTTLRPGQTTTYVLEAYNDAGDKATLEKTVAVTTPLTTSATANPTAPNSLVNLSWDVTGANPSDVIGIPAEPPNSTPASTNFVDIDGNAAAKRLLFSQTNDALTPFTVPLGFVFPVAGTSVSTFTASTNGYLVFGSGGFAAAANVDLKTATTGLPTSQLLAPFWDDLDLLTDGSVKWIVDGTNFPRRLIVQWTHAHIAGDPQTDLTFQVQLYETGEIRYEYLTLAGGSRASGDSATVGIWLGKAIFVGQSSYNTASVTDGLELQWFTNGLATGSRSIIVGTTSVSLGFFYKTAQNAYVWVPITVRVFNTNSVVINEVMHTPVSGAPEGQYLELQNNTGNDVDLGGLEISNTSAPGMTFVIPNGSNVARGGYLVVGQSNAMANNGGAPVDLAYGTAVTLAPSDTALVRVLNSLQVDGGQASAFTVSAYSWDGGVPGSSVQRDTALGGGIPRCMLTQSFGTLGSFGTPGAVNESCFPYILSSIAPDFEDVSGDGTRLLDPGTDGYVDEKLGTVTLAMPFTYMGEMSSTLTVSNNGWVSTRTQTSATFSNKSAPGSGTPIGAIAPYWDDQINNEGLGPLVSNAYAKRVGNHQIVQWSHMAPYRTTVAPRADNTGDVNYEAKLFDNGVIEFHYAAMVDSANPSSSTAASANCSSATVWLEMLDGGAALPVCINQVDGIQPNTAWRYTPKP